MEMSAHGAGFSLFFFFFFGVTFSSAAEVWVSRESTQCHGARARREMPASWSRNQLRRSSESLDAAARLLLSILPSPPLYSDI